MYIRYRDIVLSILDEHVNLIANFECFSFLFFLTSSVVNVNFISDMFPINWSCMFLISWIYHVLKFIFTHKLKYQKVFVTERFVIYCSVGDPRCERSCNISHVSIWLINADVRFAPSKYQVHWLDAHQDRKIILCDFCSTGATGKTVLNHTIYTLHSIAITREGMLTVSRLIVWRSSPATLTVIVAVIFLHVFAFVGVWLSYIALSCSIWEEVYVAIVSITAHAKVLWHATYGMVGRVLSCLYEKIADLQIEADTYIF